MSMQLLIACVFFVAAMSAYVPLVFIRKMNKVLATLERIEKNTASANAAGAAAGR